MIKFHTASDTPRPVRLSEPVREWADESLKGKYGDEAYRNYAVSMDDVAGFAELPPIKQYDCAIRRIAETAPIRICKYERVSGAATLGLGIEHLVPATYKGKQLFFSVSHLTIGYEYTLKYGLSGYAHQIEEKLTTASGRQKMLLESMLNVIESMRIWHARYMEALKSETEAVYCEDILKAL